MKSEITKTSDRRLMVCRPASSSGARSVKGDDASRGWSSRSLTSRRTWTRPPRGRDRPIHLAPEEDRPDAVSAAGQESSQRRDEVDQDAPLEPLALDRAEVDRRAEVEQEPGRDLAILDVLPHVGRRCPRRDVPVDVADVVAPLVFAEVREVDAAAVEQRPVVALEQAVESADDLPVEALEDALRR